MLEHDDRFLELVSNDCIAIKKKLKEENEDTSFFEIINSYDSLKNSIYETLRLTAHTIGAIRKVVSENGWDVTDNSNPDVPVSYHVPCGSYVGASHIVPNVDDLQ